MRMMSLLWSNLKKRKDTGRWLKASMRSLGNRKVRLDPGFLEHQQFDQIANDRENRENGRFWRSRVTKIVI